MQERIKLPEIIKVFDVNGNGTSDYNGNGLFEQNGNGFMFDFNGNGQLNFN